MKTIFISIAAYADPLLFFTVCRAIHRARHPQRLRFGIVEQSLHNNSAVYRSDPRIRYLHVHPVLSQGVSWARAKVQTLYQGEHYYLQIDSHTTFLNDWDVLLENSLEAQLQVSRKPILSTYPPVFNIDDMGQELYDSTGTHYALCLAPAPNATLTPNNPVVMFQGVWIESDRPVVGFHLAGGFIFTLGKFVREVPYDPHMYFHGEEQNLSLRAFTYGWDIFHPNVLPLYHKYKTAGEAYESHHWNNIWEAQRPIKWPERQAKAYQRLIDLAAGRVPPTDACGLGYMRTVEGFYEFCGIDYVNFRLDRDKHAWLEPD